MQEQRTLLLATPRWTGGALRRRMFRISRAHARRKLIPGRQNCVYGYIERHMCMCMCLHKEYVQICMHSILHYTCIYIYIYINIYTCACTSRRMFHPLGLQQPEVHPAAHGANLGRSSNISSAASPACYVLTIIYIYTYICTSIYIYTYVYVYMYFWAHRTT